MEYTPSHPTLMPTLMRQQSLLELTQPLMAAAAPLKRPAAAALQAPAKRPRVVMGNTPGLHLVPDAVPDYSNKWLNTAFELMQHQRENVERFINNVKSAELPSSLLISDDPGLGKTLSAVASWSVLRSILSPGDNMVKVLIVTPKSVSNQWASEILKFSRVAPWRVAVNHLDPEATFVIVSYEFLTHCFNRRYEKVTVDNRVEYHVRMGSATPLLFVKDHFKMVVYDEVHKVRNEKTKAFIATKYIAPASNGYPEYPRLGLSGTPLVNRPADVASIAKALHFSETYTKASFYAGAIESDCEGFNRTVFIRHLKDDVLELPRLTKRLVRLSLNEKEIAAQEFWRENIGRVAEDARNRMATFVELLTAVMRMRQTAIHPELPSLTVQLAALAQKGGAGRAATAAVPVKSEDDDESEDNKAGVDEDIDYYAQATAAGLESQAEQLIHGFASKFADSTKFKWLLDNLNSSEMANSGVLIYSSFSAPLRVLKYVLMHQLGIDAELYIGPCSSSQRSAAVDAFQAGRVRILLLSYSCGGVGLNLCPAANVVIHLDAPWSPATMIQATDRAHRKGTLSGVKEMTLQCRDTTDDFIANNIHVTKKVHMSKLDRLATTLRVRAPADPAAGLNLKNVMRMVDWFQRRRYTRRAPERDE
jgi:SNF2 family DNA or RNA helicase